MRSAQKSNRSRGRGNRKSGGGNNVNRVYDSAGPEGKVRGTPQQIIEKYLTLARDAQTSGDRVAAENFLQHAEHYQRILIQANAAQEQARSSQDGGEPGGQRNGDTGSRDGDDQNPDAGGEEMAQDGGEIGGMTTIDSGEGDSLLVESEEPARPASRSNGDGRRRRTKPATEAASTDADDAAEAQAEG